MAIGLDEFIEKVILGGFGEQMDKSTEFLAICHPQEDGLAQQGITVDEIARNELGSIDHNSQLWFSFRVVIISKGHFREGARDFI